MPAPYSAGSIFVSVVPSFRNNQNDIEREMKRQGRQGAEGFSQEFAKKIANELPKSVEKATRQSRQAQEKAGADAGDQYGTAFRKALGTGLKDAERELDKLIGPDRQIKVPVGVDEKEFTRTFGALLRNVSLTEADIKIGADTGQAMADIDRLIGQLRRLRDASTNPEVRAGLGSALGSMEDSITKARKMADLQPKEPDPTPSRQLGTFDATARNRAQSALASLPPVDVDADTTPAMRKVIEFRTDAYRLLDDLQAEVKLDPDDTIARMKALAEVLEGVIETADPTLEVDTSYNAAGALAQIKGWVEAVEPIVVEVEPELPEAGVFRRKMQAIAKSAASNISEVPNGTDASSNATSQAARESLTGLSTDVNIDGASAVAKMTVVMEALQAIADSNDPHVDVETRTNARKAAKEIKDGLKDIAPVEVPVTPEMGFFRKRMADGIKAASEALPEIKIGADDSDAKKRMAEIRAELAKLNTEIRVGMDLNEAKAKSKEIQRELGQLRRNNVEIEVEVNAARAIIELEAIERAAKDADKELRNGSSGGRDAANSFRAFSGVVLGVAAIGPAAIPVIGALGVAAAALVPMALAGAAGLGVLALAAHGVMDAVQAMGAVQDNAAKDAKAYASGVRNAAKSLAAAQRAVLDARQSAADNSVSAEERVESAVDRVADAEDALSKAQKDQLRAQKNLTDAREAASERLIDLQMQIRGGALAERRAYMQLAEAEVAYANGLADPGATNTEREQLLLDLDEQRFSLDQVLESNQRLADQQAETASTGVDGMQEVIDAQDNVVDSSDRISDAQKDLQDAVKDVAKAQSDQARSAADSAQAIADAQSRLIDAQLDYSDAVAKTSASQDALNTAMSHLGPSGQAFATFLFSLKDEVGNLQEVAAAGILPGVQDWLTSIVDTYGPQFTATVGGISDAVGGMFSQWATELQTPEWAAFFDMMESKAPVFISQMGDVLTNVGTGFASLATAFAPAAEDLGNSLVDMSGDFADWAAGLADSQGFQDFMEWWDRVGPEVVSFFQALADAVGNIGIALAPYGEKLLNLFTGILDWIGGLDPVKLGTFVVTIVALTVAFQAMVGLNALIAGLGAVWAAAEAALALFAGTAVGAEAVIAGIAGTIGIVLAAIVLIALGFYLLYENSETFRNIVDAAWSWIKSAISSFVDWFQTSAMPVIEEVLSKIGDFFTWLWEDIISPTIDVFMHMWEGLWDFLVQIWENFGKPMFGLIGDIFTEVWEVIDPLITLIGLAFQGMWYLLELWWNNVGKPVFDAWLAVITWLWDHVIEPVLGFIGEGFGQLFDFIESAWNATGKPVLDFFQAVVEGLVGVFQGSFDGIHDIWAALQDVLSAPIVLLVDTILNKGLIAGINHIASIFTGDDHWIPDIPTDWIPGRATGGTIPGTSPHKRADNVLIRATAGEYMQQVDAVDYYGTDIMDALNQRLIPREAIIDGLQGRATGGMIDPMWDIVSRRFPRARKTSDYRPGDPGFHGSKQAIDIGAATRYPDPSAIADMLEIDQFLGHSFPNLSELIHTGPGSINLKNGQPHQYNQQTQNEHRDHVHMAARDMSALGGGPTPNGDGDSWWDTAWNFVSHPFDTLQSIIDSVAGDFGNTQIGEMLLKMPVELAHKGVDSIMDHISGFLGGIGDFVGGLFGGDELNAGISSLDTGGFGSDEGTIRGIVQGVANGYGWGSGFEWSALSTLINKESSWNPRAQNPTSTAYGLFQFLNSTWAGVGGTKTSDPTLQTRYGLDYIKGRYGTPSAAWAYHQQHNSYADGGLLEGLSPLLYDQGGQLDPGLNLVMNATRQPEAILNPTQLANIERIADGGGRGPLVGSLHLPMVAANPHEAVDEIVHALHVIENGGKYTDMGG